MHCPVCNNCDTKVVDSRSVNEGLSIRRRRECVKCGYRFSTFEETEILGLSVIKSDGKKEAYDRAKIERGVKRSLEKRPITPERFQKLIGLIEQSIQKLKKSEVTSQQVGEIVMKHLKKFDKVAYIRFASVYQAFDDIQTFQEEAMSLMNGKSIKTSKT